MNMLAPSDEEDVRVLPYLRYMDLREDVQHAIYSREDIERGIYSGPCSTLVEGHLPQDVASHFAKAGVTLDIKVQKFHVLEDEESEHSDDW